MCVWRWVAQTGGRVKSKDEWQNVNTKKHQKKLKQNNAKKNAFDKNAFFKDCGKKRQMRKRLFHKFLKKTSKKMSFLKLKKNAKVENAKF